MQRVYYFTVTPKDLGLARRTLQDEAVTSFG